MSAKPFEAQYLPSVPDSAVDDMRNVLIAVNGSVFSGDASSAIFYAVRYLRANPELAKRILEAQ